MRFRKVVTVLMLMVLLGACQKAEEPLKMAFTTGAEAAATRRIVTPIAAYLSDGLGREVELTVVADYSALVEALKYGHIDMAKISSTGYVMAINEGAQVEPIVKAIKGSTGLPGYTSVLIAKVETDISDLNALTFAFVDVGSASGHIVPSVWLEKQGIEPREILIAGTHNAVILAIKNGTVDVGATGDHRLREAISNGIFTEDEIVVVWESELIPSTPMVVQSSMSQELKAKLTQLLLDIPVELMEGLEGYGEIGFVKATDSDYDPIREILEFKNR